MPSLVLRKSPGGTPGETISLEGDLFVIGRDADTCQIVIPHHAVSRRHAQVTRTNGTYFIEDLRSRNNTFVNNKQVTTRTQLKPADRVKICDFLFEYQDERFKEPPPIPEHMKKENEEADDPGGNTTIEATGSNVNAQNYLDTQSTDRLKALLAISQSLSRTLDLDPLLEQIAETLLKEFRQADRVFVILLDDSGKPIPKATKARRPGLDDSRFSRTIVKKAVESLKSYLSEDASSDASLGPAASIAEFRIRSVMCVPLVSPEGKALYKRRGSTIEPFFATIKDFFHLDPLPVQGECAVSAFILLALYAWNLIVLFNFLNNRPLGEVKPFLDLL